MTQAQAGMQECLVVFVRSVEVLHKPSKARAIEVQECGLNVVQDGEIFLLRTTAMNPSKMLLCARLSAGSRYPSYA